MQAISSQQSSDSLIAAVYHHSDRSVEQTKAFPRYQVTGICMSGGKKTKVFLTYSMEYAWRPNRSKYLLKFQQFRSKTPQRRGSMESPAVTLLKRSV